MTYPHPRSRIAAGLQGLVAVLLLASCSDASLESLASQALMFMGAMRDPMTGQVMQDLHQAQAMIEMLQMIEQKTKGNLVPQEQEMLKQVLDEVRMHFVRLANPPAPKGPKGPMMGNR